MNSNFAPQSIQDDAVIKLKCPECSGGLNLRRKHLGISGKCVHCKAPITAVEEEGIISLKHSAELQAAPKIEAISEVPPAPAPPAEKAASQFVPPPMPTPAPEVNAVEGESASTWGFPKREEDSVATTPTPPAEESVEAKTAFNVPDAIPTSFSAIAPTSSGSESETVVLPEEKKASPPPLHEVTPPALPTGFGFSETPSFEPAEESAPVKEAPEKISEVPGSDSSDLFESKTGAMNSPLFSNELSGGGVNSGWGAKVPNQNHASISPFSTGSAEPDPGFAETLFREKAEGDTGAIQPKSPFGELDGGDDAPLSSGALFSSAATSTKPDKEVVLDGDGRPLREMTPEEKERFASDIMQFGEYNKRSPWLKRIVKSLVTLAVLAGIGYAAYVFLPQEQIEVAKAKVLDWLEPGSVLMDYLPFEVGESEDGEKEVKIKALEGLTDLSTQMDDYLTTAENQLNETLPEGAEGYKREKPVDTPELPEIPKLPGVKMPDLPGMDTGTAE